MNDEILQMVYSPDRLKRIYVIRHATGTFGHQEESFSDYKYEMCYIPKMSHFSVFDSEETALREARERLGSLEPDAETRH